MSDDFLSFEDGVPHDRGRQSREPIVVLRSIAIKVDYVGAVLEGHDIAYEPLVAVPGGRIDVLHVGEVICQLALLVIVDVERRALTCQLPDASDTHHFSSLCGRCSIHL